MVTPMVATTRPHPRPARRSRRGSADGQVVGALLVIGGIAWFLSQVGLVHLSLATTLSCLLITLGIGLVLTARRAGGAGLVVVGLLLTVVLASTSAVDVGLLQKGVGERTFTPQSGTSLPARYQLGVGSLTLDLSDLETKDLAGKQLDVQVGVGELVVLLPPETVVPIDVTGKARAGEVDLFGAGVTDDGTNVVQHKRDRLDPDDPEPLELDLDVGLGTVQVVRVPSPPGAR
jgi:hypothetical protein